MIAGPALLALALSVADAADPTAQVTLVAQGAPVALSEPEQSQIAKRVAALMVGCGMTSVTFPDLFAARSLPAEWQGARAGSHLYIRFTTPLLTRRDRTEISEVVIGLQDPSFIGPELSRHGEDVVGHVKCSGHRALALMCATALRGHLLPGQARSCKAYDTIGEPRGTD
jgi:hypothetical protein